MTRYLKSTDSVFLFQTTEQLRLAGKDEVAEDPGLL